MWDEETAEAREIYGEADPSLFPEIHRFLVPEGCHWNDVRETPDQRRRRAPPSDAGDRASQSGHALSRLRHRRLGQQGEVLRRAAQGSDRGVLGDRARQPAVSTDVLGDAYEYLVGKFADVTRRNKAGEFYTPRSVVRMMVEILDPQEGESIYDPACGTGGMLLGAIEHVIRKGGDPRTFYGKIYGQEKNLTTSAIARMNLVLHGIEDFQIAREDTLRNPAFTDPAPAGLPPSTA